MCVWWERRCAVEGGGGVQVVEGISGKGVWVNEGMEVR